MPAVFSLHVTITKNKTPGSRGPTALATRQLFGWGGREGQASGALPGERAAGACSQSDKCVVSEPT